MTKRAPLTYCVDVTDMNMNYFDVSTRNSYKNSCIISKSAARARISRHTITRGRTYRTVRHYVPGLAYRRAADDKMCDYYVLFADSQPITTHALVCSLFTAHSSRAAKWCLYYTLCLKKLPPFCFLEYLCQMWTDFNNFWHTWSGRNVTPEGCKCVRLPDMSPHYLVKFQKVIFRVYHS